MSNEKQFFGWLPFANFVLAVFVVFIHTYNAKDYGLNYGDSSRYLLWFEDFISHDLAHLAVPLFMAISGYLFYRTATFESLKDKLKRRFKTLLIPFLLWNCIYFILYLVITNVHPISEYLRSVEKVHFTIHDIAAGVLFYKNNGIMWFLYQLIIYVLISPILLFILRAKIASLAFYVGLVVLYSIHYFEIPELSSTTMAYGIYPDMLSYYFLGAMLAVYKDVHKLFNSKIGIALIVVGQVVWIFNYSGYKLWHIYSLNWLFITLSVLGIFMLMFTSDKVLPCKWGGISFFIFTVHPFLLECVQKLAYITLPRTTLSAGIDYFLSPIITIIMIILLSKVMTKITPRIYKVLNGGR